MAKRLVERVAEPFAGCKVDRTSDAAFVIIRGVKLCGNVSANGRDYPPALFKSHIGKYENRPINFNHSAGERTVEGVGGRVKNPRVDADGTPRGDAYILKSHPMCERVADAAEHDPGLFGFSHVAICKTRRDRTSGREVVEGIETVESVDLVAQPATTSGMYEGRNVNRISLKQYAEQFGPKLGPATWGAVQKLCEEMGEAADVPVMDAPPADAPAGDTGDLKTALVAALAPMLDEAFESGDASKLIAALKDFIKLHSKHTGKAAADAPADDTPPADDKPKDESVKVNPWDVLKECRSQGYTPGDTELKALSLLATPEDRAAFIREQRAKIPAERPTGGRPSAAKKVTEDVKVPESPKDFAKLVTA